MSAILFGSISTVADTSELQRQAFNQAFETHGLDWQWDREQYRELLAKSGGQGRIAEYAQGRGETVDAAAVHRTKSSIFQESLASATLSPRAGVVDTIKGAKSQGWKVGLVTTTSGENISALLNALAPDVSTSDFDVIVTASDVDRPKPDKAAYEFAVTNLDETPADCVAIEDNVEGVEAAQAEGVACVAFPNENTAGHEFAAAAQRVDHLDVAELQQLAGQAKR
jgi:HAD superfamily hydrolase (TIGR01509 family)